MDVKEAERTAIAFAPTGPDTLVLSRMLVRDRLNGLFSIDLQLLSADFELKPDDLLGEPFGVEMKTPEGPRHFHGLVTEFRFAGTQGRLAAYEAVLRPWAWLLGIRTDCRIFQELSVPDIIKQVVEDAGFGADLDLAGLSETYEPREYCVQYNESDFDFITRLMEDEGINYAFAFEKERHVMALSDWNDAFEPHPGYETIPFYAQDGQQRREREHIFRWTLTRSLVSGAAALTDYDFAAPKKELLATSAEPLACSHGDHEVFEWPGGYYEMGPGDRRARVRREAIQAPKEIVAAAGNARGVDAGRVFELENFPRADQNKEYVVIEATHDFTAGSFESGAAAERYECRFRATGRETPLRPARVTPRPRVHGPQVALVVGASGEEIFTDEHGRIKVQFYWDRYGKKDENASCWIRVAQAWAGKGWGWQHIPRLGQEVIVEFLEGDPDRPVVTGALYNGDNAAPFALPGSKTQSGVRSNSSKGGGGSNEIRFEDAAGSEQIYIHAQKNEDIVVENDATRSVGSNRTKTIGVDETVEVGSNRTETVGVDQSTMIGSNETINIGANQTVGIGANRSWTIGANETISVGGSRAHNVALADNLAVGGAQAIEVGGVRGVVVAGAQSHAVGASDSTTIGSSQDITVGGSQTLTVTGDRSETVGKSETVAIGEDYALTAGKTISIVAEDEITIQTGEAMISMKKNGEIVIKGKDITVDATGKIAMKASKDTSIKAGGDVVLKGKKVLGN